MNKKIYNSIIDGIALMDKFLNDKVSGEVFIVDFEDWHICNFSEAKFIPKNLVEKTLDNIIEYYAPDIVGYYEPNYNIREAEPYYWDDLKLKEVLIEFKGKLEEFLQLNK